MTKTAGFEIGQTVRLKSGGCDMTVYGHGVEKGEPYTKCAWHNDSFDPQRDTYHPDMLKEVPCQK